MVKSLSFFVFWLIGSTAQAAANKLILTQKDVADLVLKQSLQSKEVDLKYQTYRFAPIEVASKLDWVFSLEGGTETDRSQLASVATVTDYDLQRMKTSFSLAKSWITGTTTTITFGRVSTKANLDLATVSASTTVINPNTADVLGLNIEQSLWNNFFGSADRAQIRAAEKLYESQVLLRRDELQEVVLQGLRVYWTAYMAQENLTEALNSRERYEKLVASVRKKSGLGYSSPGELSQVLAEAELRNQNVKTASLSYVKAINDLGTYLSIAKDTEIELRIPQSIPELPQLKKINLENLRPLKSQKLKIDSAEESLSYTRSTTQPILNLVASYAGSGVDEKSSQSFNEISSGAHPKTYIGVKFAYSFGSNGADESILNKRLLRDLEKLRFDQQTRAIEDKVLLAEKKVEATYQLAISSNKHKELTEKTVQELTRTFNQGRTDISLLIEAMNKYFASEVSLVSSIGDYYIALNEWAAVRDELIPENGESF